VLGGVGNGSMLRPRLWAGSGSQARWGGLSNKIAKPIKQCRGQPWLVNPGYANLSLPPKSLPHTQPTDKKAMGFWMWGRRTARKKPKLPINAFMGSFPRHV